MFKNKRQDTFAVLTKNDYESCSKVDIFRVCNIRETKFQMANQCIVPIMIGHGRAVIVTNVTESGLNVSTMCKTETKIIQLLGEMVIKIPDSCVVLGKTFEIHKISEMASVSNSLTLQGIEKNEARKIESRHEYKQGFSPQFKNLPKLDNEFEKNNNETIRDLQKIRFEPFTHI